MELKTALKIVWSAKHLIIVSGLLLAAAVFVGSTKIPTAFRASLNLYVSRQTQVTSDKFYTFDGYYSQQAAERYTQTVAAFLKSDETLRASAQGLGFPASEAQLKNLRAAVRVREEAPQLVSLSVTRSNSEDATNLARAVARTVIEKLTRLNRSGDSSLTIDLVETAPLLEVLTPQPVLNALVAFCLGIFLALLAVSLRFYFRENN